MITQTELKKILRYDPGSGEFSWIRTGKGRNSEVGTISARGYLVICIDRLRYMAHQLAWLYVYGSYPKLELDHKDRNPLNNKIENLRECTHSQNIMNSKVRSDNTSGYRGVVWDKQKQKYKVMLTDPATGLRFSKHFTNGQAAAQYREQTAASLFGEFIPK